MLEDMSFGKEGNQGGSFCLQRLRQLQEETAGHLDGCQRLSVPCWLCWERAGRAGPATVSR